MEYYHQLITEKSFRLLKDLARQYKFILIDGWAVFLFTGSLKSKDIDLILDYDELNKLKEKYEIVKNDRLKKYEVKIEETDIDIYLPFYSNPGLPAEIIKDYTLSREGFAIPRPEILLILKQTAYKERAGSHKGEKDKIDIFSLLNQAEIDWQFYKNILKKNKNEFLRDELAALLKETTALKEINLNEQKTAKLRKKILKELLR